MNNFQVVEFQNTKTTYIYLKKYFHETINILVCDKHFYKNKNSILSFEDRVAVQNSFLF